MLPQLVTAGQDLWHATSDTWFDRTADLRVALYGPRSASAAPPSVYLGTTAEPGTYQSIYPGLWARGSFTGLNRDDAAKTSFGSANLNCNQDIGDFQGGVGWSRLAAWRDT